MPSLCHFHWGDIGIESNCCPIGFPPWSSKHCHLVLSIAIPTLRKLSGASRYYPLLLSIIIWWNLQLFSTDHPKNPNSWDFRIVLTAAVFHSHSTLTAAVDQVALSGASAALAWATGHQFVLEKCRLRPLRFRLLMIVLPHLPGEGC